MNYLKKNILKGTSGITLIALVITVIVLLLLAGVSIAMLTGNNNLINQSSKAKLQTKIGELEEQANIESASILAKNYTNPNVQMAEIVGKLRDKGYNIIEGTVSAVQITLDKEEITVGTGKTEKIIVSYGEESINYYAEIDGKYYLMEKSNAGVKVSREGKEKLEEQENKLTARAINEKVTVEVKGTEIIVTAGSEECTDKIEVKYGESTATCDVTVKAPRPTTASVPDEKTEIKTNYGTIDIIWLNTSNGVIPEPNAPEIGEGANALKPVKWIEENGIENKEVETSQEDSSWYSYNPIAERDSSTGKLKDNLTSKWANAKNPIDNSYFVWIPRYAYRITYYESDSSTKPTGYYDGWGMWKAEDGTIKYALDKGIETVDYNGEKYIVHPAFMDNTANNFENGGWDKDIKGIWVAKYEMSMEQSSNNGSSWDMLNPNNIATGNVLTKNAGNSSSYIRAVSKPNVNSWRYINIGNMYKNAYSYDRTKESHLLKNSEWGAVAYLTQSKYGRNGNEIDINNSDSYITGNGGGAVGGKVENKEGITNLYNTKEGMKASTTGNMYGIYDMSGGACDYLATYDKSGDKNKVEGLNYGVNMTQDAKDKEGKYISTKYITAYENGTSIYSGDLIYSVCKVGEATKETQRLV